MTLNSRALREVMENQPLKTYEIGADDCMQFILVDVGDDFMGSEGVVVGPDEDDLLLVKHADGAYTCFNASEYSEADASSFFSFHEWKVSELDRSGILRLMDENMILPPSERFGRMPTLGKAVERVMMDHPEASVFAFGEVHGDGMTVNATIVTYMREVLPVLWNKGIFDIVIEHFPVNVSSEEFDEFREQEGAKDWSRMPHLKAYLGEYIRKGAADRFNTCMGILLVLAEHWRAGYSFKIHTANYTRPEDVGEYPEFIRVISEHTVSRASSLLDAGARVAIFGGMYHNDIDYSEGMHGHSGAERMEIMSVRERLLVDGKVGPSDFVEIDLLSPEIYDWSPTIEYDMPPLPKFVIPESGIMMVSEHAGLSNRLYTAVDYDPWCVDRLALGQPCHQ